MRNVATAPTTWNEDRHDMQAPGFDADYWLGHCEGYCVECEGGRLGFVEELRAPPESTGPPVLAIRAGVLGRRILLVPVEDVALVVPRKQRLYLGSHFQVVGTEQ